MHIRGIMVFSQSQDDLEVFMNRHKLIIGKTVATLLLGNNTYLKKVNSLRLYIALLSYTL